MNIDRKLVSIRKVSFLRQIEGADQIEVAHVDGWQCVVKKGEFQAGDPGLYFEIDSLLPMVPAFEFLKARGNKKMLVDGTEVEGYRLRTVRLRGELSQGLLLPMASFPGVKEGDDLAAAIGVIKYEAPIPACLAGTVEGAFPSFIQRTDQERVQNLGEALKRFQGMEFEVTEKLDGASMTAYLRDGKFGVCSRNLELKETEGNTFWRVAREMELEEKLRASGLADVALQGELVGPGVQGNPYRLSTHEFRIFDVFHIGNSAHLLPDERLSVLRQLGLHAAHVPFEKSRQVLRGWIDGLLVQAEGTSALSDVEREGIVFKSHFRVNGAPFTFKAISNKYLLSQE